MNSIEEGKSTVKAPGLKKSGVLQIVRVSIVLALHMVIVFIAAGRLDLPRAWAFLAAALVYFVVSTAIVAKYNPELINERVGKKEGIKSRDKAYLTVYLLLGLLVQPAIIGLDVGRFRWSTFGTLPLVLGYIVFLGSCVINVMTMVENPHFEATVRIQKDREHRVVSTGPYGIVRHPGYLAAILWAIAEPLAIGSVAGLMVGGVILVIMVLRTAFEDRALQGELSGYVEYTHKVKYRLFPCIW